MLELCLGPVSPRGVGYNLPPSTSSGTPEPHQSHPSPSTGSRPLLRVDLGQQKSTGHSNSEGSRVPSYSSNIESSSQPRSPTTLSPSADLNYSRPFSSLRSQKIQKARDPPAMSTRSTSYGPVDSPPSANSDAGSGFPVFASLADDPSLEFEHFSDEYELYDSGMNTPLESGQDSPSADGHGDMSFQSTEFSMRPSQGTRIPSSFRIPDQKADMTSSTSSAHPK